MGAQRQTLQVSGRGRKVSLVRGLSCALICCHLSVAATGQRVFEPGFLKHGVVLKLARNADSPDEYATLLSTFQPVGVGPTLYAPSLALTPLDQGLPLFIASLPLREIASRKKNKANVSANFEGLFI